MTFPSIAAYNTSVEVGGTTSHAVSLPAGINAGDLLICVFATDGDNTVTNWNGFTEIYSASNGTVNFLAVAWKEAVGSDTLTVTTSVSEPSAHCTYRITGWENTFNPVASTGVETVGTNPNPDNLTGLGWSQDDTLWIACSGCDRRTYTGYPSNCTLENRTANSGAAGGCSAAIAGANSNSDSFDPLLFKIDASDTWNAVTVAVAPSGATAPAGGYSVGIDRGINRGIL